MKTVSEKIRDAGDLLVQALRDPGSNISACLNSTLNELLAWPFRADSACIIDSKGKKATFNTIIYSTSGKQSASSPMTITADATAAVVHAVRDLGAEEICSGYESIAAVKRLKRTHAPELGPINNTPLGIIVAVDSALSIKATAELMVRENADRPSTEWPDMIAVLTKGTVNYAAQFEGDVIQASFTLPNFRSRVTPPMYATFSCGAWGRSRSTTCAACFSCI